MASASSASPSSLFSAGRPAASFSVQSDWEQVLREFNAARAAGGSGVAVLPKESRQFWISCQRQAGAAAAAIELEVQALAQMEEKKSDSAAAAGSSLTAAARSVSLDTKGAFDLAFLGPLQLVAHHADSGTTQLLQAPRSTLSALHQKGDVFSVDVNAAGTLGISASERGSLRTWDASTGTLSKDLVGHMGDVRLARFFPSGSVALSAGMDLGIRIWAVDAGVTAATLNGHTRPVTAVKMLDRGRTLVSAAEDGQARLWDVSKQASVRTYPATADAFAPKFHDALLLDPTAHPLSLAAGGDAADVAQGQLLLTAGSDGLVRGFDLRVGTQVLMIPTGAGGGVQCLAQGPSAASFTLGGGEGLIAVVDLRNKQPLHTMRQDDAAITSLRPWSDDAFWSTNSTGAANLWRVSGSSSAIACQLTGVDCEPIHDLCLTATTAYIASHSAVRAYAVGALGAAALDFHELALPKRSSEASAAAAK